jgi:hypothetical protein
MALLLASVIKCLVLGWTLNRAIWLAAILALLLSSSLTFHYHRRKRVYGRFALFLAVSSHPQDEKAGGRP